VLEGCKTSKQPLRQGSEIVPDNSDEVEQSAVGRTVWVGWRKGVGKLVIELLNTQGEHLDPKHQ